jgi:hypothetical protein
MDFLPFIEGFQKLRVFLTTLFPGLEHWVAPVRSAFGRMLHHPRLTRIIGPLRRSRVGQTAESWMHQNLSEDFTKYLVDMNELPREAVLILRPVFIIAVSLCFLLPIAMQFPRPAAGQIEGAQGPVAVWSIVLWLIAFCLGWSCLLAGAVICNRAALLVSLILYIYFFGLAAMELPRSYWNVLIPAVSLAAIGCAEHRFHRRSRRDAASGWILSLIGGMASGVALAALTPLAAVFSGHIFVAGIALGAALGISAMLSARHLRKRLGYGWDFAPVACLVFFCGVMLANQMILLLRGGIAVPANAVLVFLTMWTGYLWPLYFIIGVSLIIKVMRGSQELAGTIQQLIPSRFFTAVLVLLTAAATCISWNSLIFNTPRFPWPSWLVMAAAWLYRLNSWIWSDPIHAMTWEWLRWLLLFDLLAVVWLSVRRRLDSQIMSSLLFLTVFGGALIYEYQYRTSGFSRTGVHSAIVLFAFSISILWLVHTNSMKFTAKSSPRWPQLGRFGIYGALLLFVLLSVHAQGAIHQTKIVDEMLLYLFNGLIVIGIPYSLYAYATRRLRVLPLSVTGLFGAFAYGAGFCFLITAMDKLVLAGGSFQTLAETLERYRQMMLTSGIQPHGRPALPESWLMARGFLVLAGAGAYGFLARRRLKDHSLERASIMFLVIGAAMGFAAFSRLNIILPLVPLTAMILITPFEPAVALNVDLVATYLVYTLPAMILALAASDEARGRFNLRSAGMAAAFLFQALLVQIWPQQEAVLQSAGAIGTAGSAALFLFFVLILAMRSRIEILMGWTAPAEPSGPDSSGWYIGGRTLKLLAGSACVLLLTVAAWQLYASRMRPHLIPGISREVSLPAAWAPAPNAGGRNLVRFARASLFGRAPSLMVETERTEQRIAARSLLQDFARDAPAGLPGFAAGRLENWDTYFPGSAALDFTFDGKLPDGTPIPLAATRLVVPLSDYDILAATLIAVFGDWKQERWDLARLAQNLRQQDQGNRR